MNSERDCYEQVDLQKAIDAVASSNSSKAKATLQLKILLATLPNDAKLRIINVRYLDVTNVSWTKILKTSFATISSKCRIDFMV